MNDHDLCIMSAGGGYNDKYSITCYCVDESKPYCIIYESVHINNNDINYNNCV